MKSKYILTFRRTLKKSTGHLSRRFTIVTDNNTDNIIVNTHKLHSIKKNIITQPRHKRAPACLQYAK